MSKTLPTLIVTAINDYGVTCANVVKGRTTPEMENLARERLEHAIKSAIAHAAFVARRKRGVR